MNGVELDMEIDTGASVTPMGEDNYSLSLWLVVLWSMWSQQADLPLIVIKGKAPTLLGRT